MKTKTTISAIFLIASFLVISCDKPETPPIEEEIFPKEIPFTEYRRDSLPQGCSWRIGFFTTEAVIINNNEELGNYIQCSSGFYDDIIIDFSKYCVLYVNFVSPPRWPPFFLHQITNFWNIGINEYIVVGKLGELYDSGSGIGRGVTGILVPKLPNNTNIKIIMKFEDEEIDLIYTQSNIVE